MPCTKTLTMTVSRMPARPIKRKIRNLIFFFIVVPPSQRILSPAVFSKNAVLYKNKLNQEPAGKPGNAS